MAPALSTNARPFTVEQLFMVLSQSFCVAIETPAAALETLKPLALFIILCREWPGVVL